MVSITADGPIWTLDLGEDENRFSPDRLTEIESALDELEASGEPAALLTTGTGKFFSNGLDLDWVSAHPDEFEAYAARVQVVLARVLTLPVPTVAAVNGHAFGAGAMLAIAHDYRVMREDRGFFCFPEVDIQIPFTPGMDALITTKLTPRQARDAMLTGRRFGGADAVPAGLVDAATSQDALIAAAADLVRDLAGKDRATLGTIKATLYAEAAAALRGDARA